MVIVLGLEDALAVDLTAQMEELKQSLKLSPEMEGYIVGSKPFVVSRNLCKFN